MPTIPAITGPECIPMRIYHDGAIIVEQPSSLGPEMAHSKCVFSLWRANGAFGWIAAKQVGEVSSAH